jgi:hypothetical protein
VFLTDAAAAGSDGEAKGEKTATSGAQGGSSETKTFTQEELGKIVADERKAERAKARADFEAELKQKDADAKADKDASEAKARGDFEQVEAKLKADIETLRSEKTALEARTQSLTDAIEKVVSDDWGKLPDEVRESYVAAGGNDDDALAKITFLPQGKKLAEKLTERQKSDRREGNGYNPNGKSGESAGDIESEKGALRATGGYRM